MKPNVLLITLISIIVFSCEDSDVSNPKAACMTDTIAPIIKLIKANVDTAYLFAAYTDPGADVTDYDCERKNTSCDNLYKVEVTGEVNTKIPGTYTLTYNGHDNAGNEAAAVTRTVYVMEGNTGFLSGAYNTACTCTATIAGSSPTITTDSYTSRVTPASGKNNFELVALEIGPEKVILEPTLIGNSLEVFYFSPDYARSTMTGTLSESKNSFTMESTSYRYTPAIVYKCTNIYSKQLVLVERKDK